jgi:hypothetical protein
MKWPGILSGLKFSSAKTVAETMAILKKADTGIRSLDDTLKSMNVVSDIRGNKVVKGAPLGRMEKAARSANLAELLRLAGKEIPFTKAEALQFQNLVKHLPDSSIQRVAEIAETAARDRPGLKLTARDLDKASPAIKAEVAKIESNVMKRLSSGVTIGLTIGAVTMGAGWLEKAVRERQGCFMVTNLAGTTTSCKVANLSCIGRGGNFCTTNTQGYYNVTLVLMKYATMPDHNEFKQELCAAIGVEPENLSKEVRNIIDTKFQKLATFVREAALNEKLPPMSPDDPCKLVHKDVEDGKIPNCRMCDIGADPASTTYIDSKLLPITTTLHCVTEANLLEVLADLAYTTAQDIFSWFGRGFSALLRPIMYGVAVLAVVCIVIASILYFIRQHGRKKRAAEAAEDVAAAYADRTPLLPMDDYDDEY